MTGCSVPRGTEHPCDIADGRENTLVARQVGLHACCGFRNRPRRRGGSRVRSLASSQRSRDRTTVYAVPPQPTAQSSPEAPRNEQDEVRAPHRIVIVRGLRMLLLLEDADTLLKTPIAVGSGDTLRYGDRAWRFTTPAGTRTVLAKEADPVWVPPLWHFVERASENGFPLVELKPGADYIFPDGSRVVVRDGFAGHLLTSGAFIPTEPGNEVVINGILFVPPIGTESRRVRGELGAYKLDLGDGYLIHGTPHKDSIGPASTHGCIRVDDAALEFLFHNVPVGTEVRIQ